MKCQYVGLDVHKSTTTIAVRDEQGNEIGESTIATREEGLIAAIESYNQRRGRTEVVFEETPMASWLYEILRPHADRVVVCHPTDSAQFRGSKTDRIDANQLARLLRMDEITEVNHGPEIDTPLKSLVRGHIQITEEVVRVKNQLKSLFRSRNIDTSGEAIYDEPDPWLDKLETGSLKFRAQQLYDRLQLVAEHKSDIQDRMIEAARRWEGWTSVHSLPGFGDVRTATVMGLIGTPHRFAGKRKLWRYSCLAVETKTSANYRNTADGIEHEETFGTTGLNQDGNKQLKKVFVGAARYAASQYPEVQRDFEIRREDKGRTKARLDIARKLASQALTVWKRRDTYDVDKARWKH